MSHKLPLWIQEILQNDSNIKEFELTSPGQFAILPKKSSKVIFNNNDSINIKTKPQNIKVAFFRDGPFLPVSTGAVTSILGMINALVKKQIDVYLFYCYRGWSDFNLYKNQPFSTVFINPKDFYTNKKLISKIIKSIGIQICHFDSAEAVNIQHELVPDSSKILFEVHNVENELIKQLGATKKEIDRIKKEEQMAVTNADTVIVRSQENYDSIRKLGCPKEKLFIYRGGITVDNIKFKKRKFLKRNNILFLGHLNYTPNQQAVDIIATQISPKVNKKFIIAGKGSPFLKKKYQSSKLAFLGWVDDLNELFSQVDIALAPLVTGSGTRLKVLDYMAAGIPVIGTDLSIEGLEHDIKKHMIVENDFSKYPTIIETLYNDTNLTARLSESARHYVSKERNWKNCINDVLVAYKHSLSL